MMKKSVLFVMVAIFLAVSLIGCAAPAVAEEAPAETTSVTVEHKLGAVEVTKNPQTVVCIDLASVDTLKALGVADSVAAVSNIPAAYLSDVIDGLPVVGSMFEPDYEAIAELEPDLILISARTASVYEDLAEIAPTVYLNYPGIDNPSIVDTVKENVELLASLYGLEDKAAELVAELDTAVAGTQEAVSTLENKNALMLLVTGKVINAFGPEENSRYGYIYNIFGYESTTSQEQIDEDASTHGDSISFEFIAEVNPDYIFVIDRAAITGDSDVAASDTLDTEFVDGTNAGQNGNIIYISSEHWYLTVGGYSSLMQIVSELNPAN